MNEVISSVRGFFRALNPFRALKNLFIFVNPFAWGGVFPLAAKQLRNNKISFIGIWLTILLSNLSAVICANLIASSIIHPVYEPGHPHTNVQLQMWTMFVMYIMIMTTVILLSGVSFSIRRRWSMFANLRILGMQQIDLRRMIAAELIMMSILAAVVAFPLGGVLSQEVVHLFKHFDLTPPGFKFEWNVYPYIAVFFGLIVLLMFISLFASKKMKNISITHKTNPYALGNKFIAICKTIVGLGLIFGPVIMLILFDFQHVKDDLDFQHGLKSKSQENHKYVEMLINVSLILPCIGVSISGKYITYGIGHFFSKVFKSFPRVSFAFSSLKANASKLNPIFISLIITTLLTLFITSANPLSRDYKNLNTIATSEGDRKSDIATVILIVIILTFTIINILNYILLFIYDKEKSVKLRYKLGESSWTIFRSLLFEVTLITLFSLAIGVMTPLLYTAKFSDAVLGINQVIYNKTVFFILVFGLLGLDLAAATVGYLFSMRKKHIKIRYIDNLVDQQAASK